MIRVPSNERRNCFSRFFVMDIGYESLLVVNDEAANPSGDVQLQAL